LEKPDYGVGKMIGPESSIRLGPIVLGNMGWFEFEWIPRDRRRLVAGTLFNEVGRGMEAGLGIGDFADFSYFDGE
jgi:hypothetical protein